MVNWRLFLSDGSQLSGESDDGSWKKVNSQLKEKEVHAIGMEISNPQNGSSIDKNAYGYFFSKRCVVGLNIGINQYLVGIGYQRTPDDPVRIKWHDERTMELVETEARPAKNCGISLITKG